MSGRGRACDDCSDGPCQLLRPRVVDKPNLMENKESQRPSSELGSGTRIDLYGRSSTIMSDRGIAEVVPNQRIRYASKSDLSGDSESCRPRVCPATSVEHGKNP